MKKSANCCKLPPSPLGKIQVGGKKKEFKLEPKQPGFNPNGNISADVVPTDGRPYPGRKIMAGMT